MSALPAAPVLHAKYICPECRADFKPKHWRSLFCCPAHRAAFHNRSTVRGRVLTPLAMTVRQTRGGSRVDPATGRAARQKADRLMQDWTDEDRAAGRMSLTEYVARRTKMGFDE